MKITALARETFMNYEIHYNDDNELDTILQNLRDFKYTELCLNYDVFVGNYGGSHKGCIYACLRCDAVETLCYRLASEHDLTKEILTVDNEFKEMI